VITLIVVTLAGCSVSVHNGNSGRPSGGNPYRGGLGQGGRTPTSQQVDEAVRNALKDVERYWSTTFPQLAGKTFTPVQGGYHPYTRSKPPPACGQEPSQYQPNAFYCPAGDFIAWDAETLIPRLYTDFGPFLVATVMAHEYGHAIQARLGIAGQPTIVLEQQADCFAGSWASDVRAGHSEAFKSLQPDQLDNTVAGLLMLRDQPGTPAVAQQAHGNAFDRIRAFQEGFEQNAPRCASYRADNLPVTEVPFTSTSEAATGGNLAYGEALQALVDDLQAYWTRTFPQLGGRPWEPLRVVPFDPTNPPACGAKTRSKDEATGAAFYCAQDKYVAFDNVGLGPALYDRIGDNAVGMLLGDLFAQAAQDRRGRSTQGHDAQLAIDCLAGSWTFARRSRRSRSRVTGSGPNREQLGSRCVRADLRVPRRRAQGPFGLRLTDRPTDRNTAGLLPHRVCGATSSPFMRNESGSSCAPSPIVTP
jgi:predicted metalloprotease